MENKETKGNALKKILLFLVGAAIVVGVCYFAYDYYQKSVEKQMLMTELTYQGAVLAKESENVEVIRQENEQIRHIRDQLITGNYDPDLKVCFLTFDDGPNESSNEVLDILKQYGVKATFFTNGNNGNSDPKYLEIYKRYVNEGHAVGNHTWDHNYSLYKNPPAFYESIKKQEDFIRQATGQEPIKLFRFPGGSNMTNSSVADGVRSMGYNYYDWNATTGDGAAKILPAQQAMAKVFTELGNEQVAVVLMHAENPVKTTSREALPGIIETFQSKGYQFMTLDPSYNLTRFIEPSF